MRIILILCFNLIFYIGHSQERESYIFEEYTSSLNRPYIFERSDETAYFGMGFGLSHLFQVDKSADLLLGIEYNRTSFNDNSLKIGNVSYGGVDLKYTTDYLSIPMDFRFYFDKKKWFFFELGGYLDFTLRSRRKGTWGIFGSPVDGSSNIDEASEVSHMFGYCAAMGILVPISNIKILIKPEFKIGSIDLQQYDRNFYKDYYRIVIGVNIHK